MRQSCHLRVGLLIFSFDYFLIFLNGFHLCSRQFKPFTRMFRTSITVNTILFSRSDNTIATTYNVQTRTSICNYYCAQQAKKNSTSQKIHARAFLEMFKCRNLLEFFFTNCLTLQIHKTVCA